MTRIETSKHLLFLIFGIHLACLQFSHLFLLEAYLSSRAITYFINLFFWLFGFLIGLNLKKKNLMLPLVCLGLLGYEIAFFANTLFPYQSWIYLILALSIMFSSIQAGYFFPWATNLTKNSDQVLFQENNGFIWGLLIFSFAAIYNGVLFLNFAPLTLSVLVIFMLWKLPKINCVIDQEVEMIN